MCFVIQFKQPCFYRHKGKSKYFGLYLLAKKDSPFWVFALMMVTLLNGVYSVYLRAIVFLNPRYKYLFARLGSLFRMEC